MRSCVRCFQLMLAVFLSVWLLTAQADEKEEFSEANNLLFLTDHLGNISSSARLNYHFVKSGTIEDGFEDDIKLRFKPAKLAENRKINIELFSGKRKRWTPNFSGATGNPVLTLFLQRDIHQMQRLTDGKWRHFQKRIKLALENGAKIKPVEFTFDGKQYQGKEITIHPYLDDPYNKRFKKYSGKYYVFTLSDKLPGMIYKISAIAPDAETGSGEEKPALISEIMTLTAVTVN